MESILTSVKKLIGLTEDYVQFDQDIIMHINSVFLNLTQIGVGPEEGFFIEDETAEWVDFIGDSAQLQAVKTYMYLKVKTLFDPHSLSGPVLQSMNEMIREYEYRLMLAAESLAEESTM